MSQDIGILLKIRRFNQHYFRPPGMLAYLFIIITHCFYLSDEKSNLELKIGEMENELALTRKVMAESEKAIALMKDEKVWFK